jgi:hypothetical protein
VDPVTLLVIILLILLLVGWGGGHAFLAVPGGRWDVLILLLVIALLVWIFRSVTRR